MSSMNESIKIYVRMRPQLQNEDEIAWKIHKEQNSIVSLPRDPQSTRRYADAFYSYKFTFDKMFSSDDKNENIFIQIKELLQYALQGFNATLFLYGQTTSGKTYTMLGDQENPGLLPLTLLDLFKECQLPIAISYLEIYNEQINDLLQVGATNLRMQDINGQSIVHQLKVQSVNTFDDALSLLCDGEEQRMYRERQMHEHSSRSHTIFQILIQHETHISTLSLVDLAGSERLNEEDASEETGYINKSLFVLSNVVNKLAEGKKSHIPYRDSKLTRYLQTSLGGNSFTTIICTLSPASQNFYQTLSTLRFAQRAKKVENKIQKQESINRQGVLLDQLQFELNEIKQERDQLKQQLQQQQQQQQQQNINNNSIEQLIDVFISITGLFVENKQKYIEDISILKQVYNDQHNKLISSLQKQILLLCDQVNLPEFLINPINQSNRLLVQQYKNYLNQKLQDETIFSNVYVQSVLNPQSDYQHFQNKEIMPLVEFAYQEATHSLESKFQEINYTIQNLAELSVQNYKFIDELSYKNYLENISQEINWMTTSKNLLLSSYNKKLNVLQTAVNNVQKNFNEFQLPKTNISTMLKNITNTISPIIRQSINTPKFTERDKTILFVWGSGKDGRLGNGSQSSQPLPIKLPLQNIQSISCGYYHSAAISMDQSLYIWGKAYNSIPQKLSLQNMIQVACGCTHTLALSQDGTVYSWGYGDEGQLGYQIDSKEPTAILNNVLFIAASRSHSAAIKNDNSLYCWGSNLDYKLGLEERKIYSTPTNTGLKVITISLGTNHSSYITIDNKIYTTGNGEQGQLGKKVNDCYLNLELEIKAIEVICGEDITMFITKNGEVYSCGKKSNGNLGHFMNSIPTYLTEPKLIENLQNIKQLMIGKRHCLAIQANKQVWGWGFNFFDQLGLGDKNKFIETPIMLTINDAIQVACGEYHSLALCQS